MSFVSFLGAISFCVDVCAEEQEKEEKHSVVDEYIYTYNDSISFPVSYNIDEIVVVGYGVAHKKDLTGANATLSPSQSVQGVVLM